MQKYITRRVPLVEQELLTLPDHQCSPPILSRVRVTRSLVLCVMFCRSLFVFSRVHVTRSLVLCVMFCRSLFVFSSVRVTRSLVLCVMFCRSLFVFLTFFFWPLCCLTFFDLRNMITPLVSSNSSCICISDWYFFCYTEIYYIVPLYTI
jgi:hypothetical protein